MKVEMLKKKVLPFLTVIARTAVERDTMPVLSHVLIETKGKDGIRISATDLDIFISGEFPAEVKEEGSVVVPAKVFLKLVSESSSDEIKIHKNEEKKATISYGRSKFKLVLMNGDDFPERKEVDFQDGINIETGHMFDMIRHTSFSISKDEGRPHINGALFQGEKNKLRMVSTDGYRMSTYEVSVDDSDYDFEVLIPRKGVLKINDLIGDGRGDISIVIDEALYVKRESEDIVIEAKVGLAGGDFPPYERLIPEHIADIPVHVESFLESLKRVLVMRSERDTAIELNLMGDDMALVFNNNSKGTVREILGVDYNGEDKRIGINGNYLVDILGVMDGDEIEMGIGEDSNDPVLIKGEEGRYTGVIMPMRV